MSYMLLVNSYSNLGQLLSYTLTVFFTDWADHPIQDQLHIETFTFFVKNYFWNIQFNLHFLNNYYYFLTEGLMKVEEE